MQFVKRNLKQLSIAYKKKIFKVYGTHLASRQNNIGEKNGLPSSPNVH